MPRTCSADKYLKKGYSKNPLIRDRFMRNCSLIPGFDLEQQNTFLFKSIKCIPACNTRRPRVKISANQSTFLSVLFFSLLF